MVRLFRFLPTDWDDSNFRGVAQFATELGHPYRRGSPAIGEIAGGERLVRGEGIFFRTMRNYENFDANLIVQG